MGACGAGARIGTGLKPLFNMLDVASGKFFEAFSPMGGCLIGSGSYRHEWVDYFAGGIFECLKMEMC